MARPLVKLTWTVSGTSYRLVQDDPDTGGSYTIETAELDAVGGTSWQTYAEVLLTSPDRQQARLTAPILAGMFDKLYPT